MIEFTAKVHEVLQQTHDVRSYRMNKPEGFLFIPGQFCTITIPGKFNDEPKPFTFSSSPADPYLELTIKQMGPFTTYLAQKQVPFTIKVAGPEGEQLNFDGSTAQDVVFIAGGSGITPFMSALRYARDRKLPNRITVIYSNRTEGDIIFREELDALPGQLTVVNTLTDKAGLGWKGESGFISKEMIRRHVDDPQKLLWYICGPPKMIESIKAMLSDLGIGEDKIRIEPWQIPGKSG